MLTVRGDGETADIFGSLSFQPWTAEVTVADDEWRSTIEVEATQQDFTDQ